MSKTSWTRAAVSVVVLGVCGVVAAQNAAPPDTPAVTVRGQTYTPRSILSRNMGTEADQTTAFPPHKVIGNIYYVGTRTLSSFLITTPAGHILINSTYERNVRTIAKSVEQLGFKFSDVRILLGTHAHGDHQEGDALVKELTGAQVMAMREDVPALEAMRPGRKGASDRSHAPRRRRGIARRHDAGRAPDCGSHAWLHHVDDEGRGGRKDVRRRIRVQLSRARNRDASRSKPSSVVRSGLCARYRATCRSAIIRRNTTWRPSTRRSSTAPAIPFSMPPTAGSRPRSRRRCSARRSSCRRPPSHNRVSESR